MRDKPDPALRAGIDAVLCRRFTGLEEFCRSGLILMYAPVGSEPDIRPIARAAWASGKAVAFPLCDPKNKTMTFHVVSSLDDLTPGYAGIPEPPADAPTPAPETAAASICVVPALAFDLEGYRLGYGGGYYDRFLRDYRGTKAGLCRRDLVVRSLPREDFDVRVDILVTEKGVLPFNV